MRQVHLARESGREPQKIRILAAWSHAINLESEGPAADAVIGQVTKHVGLGPKKIKYHLTGILAQVWS